MLFRKHEAAPYDGGPLCPCGYRYPETLAVMPGYSYTFGVNFAMLRENAVSESLLPLVYGFFKKGGMQLQVNVISKEDMLDALIHPENHENPIVRVAGYSEHFNRLSPEHKMQIIARTEFDIM